MKKLQILLVTLALLLGSCASGIRGAELAAEYYNLGNAYYELGRYAEAVTFYRKAASLDPENRKARFNLALALIDDRRPEEALVELRELSAEDPDNLEVLGALAFGYHAAGAEEQAIDAYRQLLEKAPASSDARFNLATILWKTERREEALAEFLTLLEGSPDDLGALLSAGTLLLELEQYQDSADVLGQYVQVKPEDPSGYLLLGRAYRGLERYDRALEAYENALIYDEELAAAWFESAEILLTKVEDPERGITALEQALAYGFRDPEALEALVDSDGLLERDRVLALLVKNGVAPGAQGQAREPKSARPPEPGPADALLEP